MPKNRIRLMKEITNVYISDREKEEEETIRKRSSFSEMF